MTKYKAEFSYSEPRWGIIEEPFSADSVEEAEDMAMDWIETSYPEASDITINIEEVK